MKISPTKLLLILHICFILFLFHFTIITIVFFFMILILLYRFDTVNSFLALCFIISNLINYSLIFNKAQLFICKIPHQ